MGYFLFLGELSHSTYIYQILYLYSYLYSKNILQSLLFLSCLIHETLLAFLKKIVKMYYYYIYIYIFLCLLTFFFYYGVIKRENAKHLTVVCHQNETRIFNLALSDVQISAN